MNYVNWSTTEQLQSLLFKLVEWDSRTGTEGEVKFPNQLKDVIGSMPYFQEHVNQLKLHDIGGEGQALTALYKSNKTEKTIILMSHFDTVHVEEFGADSDLAFYPKQLMEKMKSEIEYLQKEVRDDLRSNHYLFGRGTMDMKAGLAIHMQMLEKAIIHQWPVNLLLVTVPDEEVNSAGMRGIVPSLVSMQKQFNLNYELTVNSEPTFTEVEKDETYHIYTGSVGKIMPGALFYGKETHAGQLLSGLNSKLMADYLTQEMEWNENFIEEDEGERTPHPVCLQMNDLKTTYSVQISHHSYALYNVFLLQRNAEQMMAEFRKITAKAMLDCDKKYEEICQRNQLDRQFNQIKVMEFQELHTYIKKKLSHNELLKIEEKVFQDDSIDDREKSVKLYDIYMGYCTELAPDTMIFFTPPYYPAVTTVQHSLNKNLVPFIQSLIKKEFQIDAKHVHYFPGISDLSYLNYDEHDEGWKHYKSNTPGWGQTYEIHFEAMKQLQVPLINIGPFGKDAHKMTERLHKKSAFVHTPYIIEKIIKKLF